MRAYGCFILSPGGEGLLGEEQSAHICEAGRTRVLGWLSPSVVFYLESVPVDTRLATLLAARPNPTPRR